LERIESVSRGITEIFNFFYCDKKYTYYEKWNFIKTLEKQKLWSFAGLEIFYLSYFLWIWFKRKFQVIFEAEMSAPKIITEKVE